VPNSHLVEQFEEVIDALVYELYFEEDFRRASIEFLKYAARDFPPIENLPRTEKIKTIHAAYQTLRQKDGEIRNNLKLMDIRLADLIMPIKTAR
jgi:adenine-specific DNA-methyltransferase